MVWYSLGGSVGAAELSLRLVAALRLFAFVEDRGYICSSADRPVAVFLLFTVSGCFRCPLEKWQTSMQLTSPLPLIIDFRWFPFGPGVRQGNCAMR